jgi:hypothetical protein
VGERYTAHWLGLSAIFLGLSLDEAASFHEMVSVRLHETFGFSGYLYYPWVIPGALFAAVVGVSFLRFLVHLPSPIRRLFMLAGSLYVEGALGVEFFQGNAASTVGNATVLWSLVFGPIEEGLEMLGVLVFLYALCTYLADYAGPVKIVFEPLHSPD